MYHYIKAMYDAWCDGQDEIDISRRYKCFIKLASRLLYRDEEYLDDYLKKQPWFKYHDKELL